MIQKLECETHKDGNGNVYGAIPSDAEIIAKINEVIDYINSRPGEKPSEELEEAAESYEEEQLSDYGYRGEWSGAFIAGANWQKEQMMKDAVNAEITLGRLPDDWSLAYNPDELHRALLKFKSGDKVKIIIVKQDDRPGD